MEKIVKKENNIKLNYFYSMVAKFFALFIPIVITPYLSRILEADGNGRLSYLSSIVSYFILFANIGIETYGQKIIAVHKNDKSYLKTVSLEIGLLRFILTIISLSIFYFIFIFLYKEYQILALIYSFTLLFTAFDFTWFFQGIEDFKSLAISNVIAKIIYIPLVFILVKEKADINVACILSVLCTILPYVICLPKMFYYFKDIKINSTFNPFYHFKECMVYFIPTIAIQIYTVLDKTMIGLITGSEFENGYYEQAEKIVKLPLTIITTLNIVMRSRISYYYSIGKIDQIKKMIDNSIKFSLCISIPICFGICAISKSFVPLYLGEGYDKCVILMYFLSPLLVIISISNVLGTHYYTPFDKQGVSNKFLIIGSIVNLILNSFLIYFFKSIGAAVASVIAEFVVTTLYVVFAKEVYSFDKIFKNGWKFLLSGCIMFVVVFMIDINWSNNEISQLMLFFHLCVEIIIGIIIYFIILIMLKDNFILSTIKKVVGKLKRKGV